MYGSINGVGSAKAKIKNGSVVSAVVLEPNGIKANNFVTLADSSALSVSKIQTSPEDSSFEVNEIAWLNETYFAYVETSNDIYAYVAVGKINSDNSMELGTRLLIDNGHYDTYGNHWHGGFRVHADPENTNGFFATGSVSSNQTSTVFYFTFNPNTLELTLRSTQPLQQYDGEFYGHALIPITSTVFAVAGHEYYHSIRLDRSTYTLTKIASAAGKQGVGGRSTVKVGSNEIMSVYSGGNGESWYSCLVRVSDAGTITLGTELYQAGTNSGILSSPGSPIIKTDMGTVLWVGIPGVMKIPYDVSALTVSKWSSVSQHTSLKNNQCFIVRIKENTYMVFHDSGTTAVVFTETSAGTFTSKDMSYGEASKVLRTAVTIEGSNYILAVESDGQYNENANAIFLLFFATLFGGGAFLYKADATGTKGVSAGSGNYGKVIDIYV